MIGSSMNLLLYLLRLPASGPRALPCRSGGKLAPQAFIDVALPDHGRVLVVESVLLLAACCGAALGSVVWDFGSVFVAAG